MKYLPYLWYKYGILVPRRNYNFGDKLSQVMATLQCDLAGRYGRT